MSPIDKITEPTFTNSSKGLLTLFCIGLVHAVVGVDLKTTEIAIPWLPSINFPNTDRLQYLYWGLVGFSVYRYLLHNIAPFKESYFKAICIFLRSPFGKSFINKTIYSPKLSHQIKVIDDEESEPKICIEHYDFGEEYGPTGAELMATFTIKFSKDYSFESFTYSENPDYIIDEISLKNESSRSKWGLTKSFFDEYDRSVLYMSSGIESKLIYFRFRISTSLTFFKLLLGNKDIFDLSIPILLNVVLFLYYITPHILTDL